MISNFFTNISYNTKAATITARSFKIPFIRFFFKFKKFIFRCQIKINFAVSILYYNLTSNNRIMTAKQGKNTIKGILKSRPQSFQLNNTLKARLIKASDVTGMKHTEIIRQAIDSYLNAKGY